MGQYTSEKSKIYGVKWYILNELFDGSNSEYEYNYEYMTKNTAPFHSNKRGLTTDELKEIYVDFSKLTIEEKNTMRFCVYIEYFTTYELIDSYIRTVKWWPVSYESLEQFILEIN